MYKTIAASRAVVNRCLPPSFAFPSGLFMIRAFNLLRPSSIVGTLTCENWLIENQNNTRSLNGSRNEFVEQS